MKSQNHSLKWTTEKSNLSCIVSMRLTRLETEWIPVNVGGGAVFKLLQWMSGTKCNHNKLYEQKIKNSMQNMAYSLYQKKLYTCVKAKYPKARRTSAPPLHLEYSAVGCVCINLLLGPMVYAYRSNCIYAWVANKRIGEYAWRCGKDFGVCIRIKNTSLFSKSVVRFQKRFLKLPTRNSATRWRFVFETSN